MDLWDRIKDSVNTTEVQLAAEKYDLTSEAFRDASMAMSALVTASDGSVDITERQRVAQLISADEALQNFPADELRRRFENNLTRLTGDFDYARARMLQDVARAEKEPAEARAVIQLGIIIGCTNGDFDGQEQALVREACHMLHLLPHEFDL